MEHCDRFLYSVNSRLAYMVNKHFYGHIHYVWCAPRFFCAGNPPSSNPREIFNMLSADVDRKDRHSSKIEQNRMGIIKGANIKKSNGDITAHTLSEIVSIVNNAGIEYFHPLIYVIDRELVRDRVKNVNALDKAEFFSSEFMIEELVSNEFDVLEMRRNHVL